MLASKASIWDANWANAWDMKTIASDNTEIPKEVHSLWGTDDTVIETYILKELGLTKLATTLD